MTTERAPTTPFVTIPAGTNTIEFDWRRSSAPGANNGTFALTVNGTPLTTLTGIDNDLTGIDAGRLGLLSVKTGANGSLLPRRLPVAAHARAHAVAASGPGQGRVRPWPGAHRTTSLTQTTRGPTPAFRADLARLTRPSGRA